MSKEVHFINGFSIFIVVFLWLLYAIVVNKQHGFVSKETYRLQVLSNRCALCFTTYSIIILISLLFPVSFFGLEVVVSIFEGYSFYCYFAFVVTNLGGPDATVKIMNTSGRAMCVPEYCCNCCCPEDRAAVYNKTWRNQWHFIFTRTAVVLIATIAKYAGHNSKASKAVFVILSVIAFMLLVNGVLSVVNFYENVMNECSNLKGIMKFLVLKVSVGMLVFQTLVTEGVIETGHVSLSSNSEFNANDRALRLTLFVTLCEYFFLGCCMFFAFGAKMDPSPHLKQKDLSNSNDDKKSLSEFFVDTLRFTDVFNSLGLKEGSIDQALIGDRV